eukprot:GHVU01178343.1.p1 GENE.GHVU01178343.1~~GHVU01178343.1.p1  ORF type:complete len:121 (+),score=13.03 GHVU01178343.1:676-1038(+)
MERGGRKEGGIERGKETGRKRGREEERERVRKGDLKAKQRVQSLDEQPRGRYTRYVADPSGRAENHEEDYLRTQSHQFNSNFLASGYIGTYINVPKRTASDLAAQPVLSSHADFHFAPCS